MESSCASAPITKEPENIEAAGKARERETNASNLFKAPQAAEKRETNAPCRRKTAENMGARETNVSEKETAATRRDGEPLTSAVQERRQEVTAAAEHQAAGESSSLSQERTAAKDGPHRVCPDPGAGGKVEEDGYRSDTAETVRVKTPPTDPAAGNGMTRHTRCSRRQLIRFLKGGSEYFNPEEVRRIIPAARLAPKGSLNAIYMLDEDMMLFTHAFPDVDEGELRAQCRSTVSEYEESMQAWEETEDTGELDSSSTDSEDEDELTGEDLLRALDKPPAVIGPATVPKALPCYIDWPERVLRQTILVASIAAENESNINRTD
jgi:hypothetical protein